MQHLCRRQSLVMLSLLKDCLWEPIPLLIILLFYALYAFLTSTFDYWLVRGVPYRKPTPLFGNFGELLLFRKSQPEGVSEMYNWFSNERFFGVFRVRSPILIVRDPELIKCICVKDFQMFCNRGIPVNSTKDPLSGHLFNLEGKIMWLRLVIPAQRVFDPTVSFLYLAVMDMRMIME